jgi:hypothetical protein
MPPIQEGATSSGMEWSIHGAPVQSFVSAALHFTTLAYMAWSACDECCYKVWHSEECRLPRSNSTRSAKRVSCRQFGKHAHCSYLSAC